MLPLIMGFLGSAFAPAVAGATGIAALASPLLAGSVGAGLGSAIQTGDIGEGLKTGLGAYAGGALLGGLFGGGQGALAAPLPGQTVVGTGAGAMTAGTPLTIPAGGSAALLPPTSAIQGSQTFANRLFGGNTLGTAVNRGLGFASTPSGIGALMGATLATPETVLGLPRTKEEGLSQFAIDAENEMQPIPRQIRFPGQEYMPGVSPEFNYGSSTPFSYTDVLNYRDRGVRPFAEGGKTEIEEDDDTREMDDESERPMAGNEKTEIVDAVMAIKGQHPQPEIALGKFLAKYGEDALRNLVDSVQSGEFDETVSRFQRGEKGAVRGPGDGSGVDDKVPATIEGQQDVLLADGEFVLRKDATDALEKRFGGGFLSAVNDAGNKAPEVLKKKAAA